MYNIAPAEVPIRCYKSEVKYMEGVEIALLAYKNWKTRNMHCKVIQVPRYLNAA